MSSCDMIDSHADEKIDKKRGGALACSNYVEWFPFPFCDC